MKEGEVEKRNFFVPLQLLRLVKIIGKWLSEAGVRYGELEDDLFLNLEIHLQLPLPGCCEKISCL